MNNEQNQNQNPEIPETKEKKVMTEEEKKALGKKILIGIGITFGAALAIFTGVSIYNHVTAPGSPEEGAGTGTGTDGGVEQF